MVNALALLDKIIYIRVVEELIAERYSQQEMRCPVHLCIGQEAIGVGVSSALTASDVVFSNHRAHGHYLSKGGSLRGMIAEMYGRSNGCCGGRGGSMHLIDQRVGFLGSTPIVGGTIPVAVGYAWSIKLREEENIAVVYFGDGCFEEGVVHECMNFAALHRLPIIFVCENNEYSVYTRLSDRQPHRPISNIPEAHGLTTFVGDGSDVEEVSALSVQAANLARNGCPCFVEFSVYRTREHCGPNYDGELGYRTDAEIAEGEKSCPILRLQDRYKLSDSYILDRRRIYSDEAQRIFSDVISSPDVPEPLDWNCMYA